MTFGVESNYLETTVVKLCLAFEVGIQDIKPDGVRVPDGDAVLILLATWTNFPVLLLIKVDRDLGVTINFPQAPSQAVALKMLDRVQDTR